MRSVISGNLNPLNLLILLSRVVCLYLLTSFVAMHTGGDTSCLLGSFCVSRFVIFFC